MRIAVEVIGPGMGPNELLVSVPDMEDPDAQAFVHASHVSDGRLEIHQPTAVGDRFVIVELPSETQRGKRRIRVLRSLLSPSPDKRAA